MPGLHLRSREGHAGHAWSDVSDWAGRAGRSRFRSGDHYGWGLLTLEGSEGHWRALRSVDGHVEEERMLGRTVSRSETVGLGLSFEKIRFGL